MSEELTAEEKAAKEAEETKVVAEKQATELKAKNKTEALRELSEELKINAFEPEEIKKKFNEFTEWQTAQKSEQEKLQEAVDTYKTKESEWQSKKLEYETMIEASKLGIDANSMVDALKLAEGDPNKLAEVVAKYPMFKSKKGIQIGVNQTNDGREPGTFTEHEKYMEENYKNNPYYKK